MTIRLELVRDLVVAPGFSLARRPEGLRHIGHSTALRDVQYFKEDLGLLQTFINDELVEVDDNEIRVTLRGRLLIRNICMCFDKYLRAKARQQQFSRVI